MSCWLTSNLSAKRIDKFNLPSFDAAAGADDSGLSTFADAALLRAPLLRAFGEAEVDEGFADEEE